MKTSPIIPPPTREETAGHLHALTGIIIAHWRRGEAISEAEARWILRVGECANVRRPKGLSDAQVRDMWERAISVAQFTAITAGMKIPTNAKRGMSA